MYFFNGVKAPTCVVILGRHTTSSDLTAEETERVREAQNLVKRLRKEAFEVERCLRAVKEERWLDQKLSIV